MRRRSGGAALTHGFQVAFYVLAAIAIASAVAAYTLLEPRQREQREELTPSFEEAA